MFLVLDVRLNGLATSNPTSSCTPVIFDKNRVRAYATPAVKILQIVDLSRNPMAYESQFKVKDYVAE